MADDSRIGQLAQSFDADQLVKLALAPLVPHLDAMPAVQVSAHVLAPAPVRRTRAKKSAPVTVMAAPKNEDIEIPTLMIAAQLPPARKRSANASKVLKVAHG